MSTEYNIGFDYSHKNKLIIEDPGFTDFIEFLFNSDLKLGKIEAGITYKKLSAYNVFIIGVPIAESYLTPEEIEDLLKYVKDGGSLLIVNDKGGDHENNNNLSELTKHFGIKFNHDQLFDNENFSKDNSRPIIKEFKKHFITRDITQIIHSVGCTLEIDKSVENEDIDVSAVAFSSEESAWHKYLDGEEWVDEPVESAPIIAIGHYGMGKIVAIGNLSLFSGFHDSYGIHAADNFKLISNVISWLMNKAHSQEAQLSQPIYTAIPIKQDLYYWMKEKLDEGRWNTIEEIVNFTLKVVKFRMRKQEPQEE
ncbi:MAG: hypothetical protein CEE42_05990 [Promethearchaeota archaeon Loki_b31]|nr:MAG: hypothetical protein CEE42_05990 [Candidatus Lokiarchaeota archaeon Loki_b31]